jgi:hypothetical protein
MIEDARMIQLDIRHYQELLKLKRHTAETRQRVIDLLRDAQARLPAAAAQGMASRRQAR